MKTILTICSALMMFFGCKHADVLKTVEGNKVSSQMKVKAGKEFKIELSTNPTTGYSWYFGHELDKNLVSFIDKNYVQDDNPNMMVGVGGTETWKFKALKAGKAYIHFVSRRGDEKPTEEKIFEIIIE